MAYKINTASINLIKQFEGWKANAYKDPVGIWTIGYGHTSAAGAPKVKAGLRLTRAQGVDLLRSDLQKYAHAVSRAVKIELNANQFGALVSFCYNVGGRNFRKSSVLKRVNAGKFSEVPSRLLLWNKAGGRVLRGLTNRRRAEGKLFMKAVGAKLPEPIEVPNPVPPKIVKVPHVPVAVQEVVDDADLSNKLSSTNLAAGAGAVAGVTAAGKEVADNVSSMMDAAPWLLCGAVILGCGFYVWRERHRKSAMAVKAVREVRLMQPNEFMKLENENE